MEVHEHNENIVQDIVEEIIDEIEDEYIIMIDSVHGFKVVVDFDFLKTCEKLKGAKVFKRLFKLKKFNDINCNLMKDKNGNISILRDLNIKNTDWNLFMGIIPPIGDVAWINVFNDYKNYNNQQ